MTDFSFVVDIDLENLAGKIGRSTYQNGLAYQDVIKFVISIDAWIGDLDFSKELHDELGEIIAREM